MARITHCVNVPSGTWASRLSPLQVAGAGRRLERITQQHHTHTETPLYFSPFSRLLRTAPFSSLHGCVPRAPYEVSWLSQPALQSETIDMLELP